MWLEHVGMECAGGSGQIMLGLWAQEGAWALFSLPWALFRESQKEVWRQRQEGGRWQWGWRWESPCGLGRWKRGDPNRAPVFGLSTGG